MALLKREVADSELTALLREQLEDFTAEGKPTLSLPLAIHFFLSLFHS